MIKRLSHSLLPAFLILGLVLLIPIYALQPAFAAPDASSCEDGCVTTGFPATEEGLDGDSDSSLTNLQTESSTMSLTIKPLKAVLVVGPIDGDQGAWTKAEVSNSQKLAQVFQQYGVEVVQFYPPNNRWEDIVAAAKDAHFLEYRGHGISWGGDPEKVGGFALKDRLISPEKVQAELRLAKNAIVMVYACYAAGTTNTDQPPGISKEEALRRVGQFSMPFFHAGAAGYYADWYGHAFTEFVTDLFAGKTLGEAYKDFNFDPATFSQFQHPNFQDQAVWLDSHFYADQHQYNHAFAGQPEATLQTLFTPSMIVGPEQIVLTTESASPPEAFAVSVAGNTDYPFEWHADMTDQTAWAQLSSNHGINGEQLTVVLNPDGMENGTYSTNLAIQSTTPGLLNDEQSLPITLRVVDYSSYSWIYLPMLKR